MQETLCYSPSKRAILAEKEASRIPANITLWWDFYQPLKPRAYTSYTLHTEFYLFLEDAALVLQSLLLYQSTFLNGVPWQPA